MIQRHEPLTKLLRWRRKARRALEEYGTRSAAESNRSPWAEYECGCVQPKIEWIVIIIVILIGMMQSCCDIMMQSVSRYTTFLMSPCLNLLRMSGHIVRGQEQSWKITENKVPVAEGQKVAIPCHSQLLDEAVKQLLADFCWIKQLPEQPSCLAIASGPLRQLRNTLDLLWTSAIWSLLGIAHSIHVNKRKLFLIVARTIPVQE